MRGKGIRTRALRGDAGFTLRLARYCHSALTPASHTGTLQQKQQQQQQQDVEAGEADGGSTTATGSPQGRPAPSSTYAGVRVDSYVLSPVFEEHHCLWQWRTVAWHERLHAVPFLLHCAPGVPLCQPFLHHTVAEAIVTPRGQSQSVQTPADVSVTDSTLATSPVGAKRRGGEGKYAALTMPSPIGVLPVMVATPSVSHPMAGWVGELFALLERGTAQVVGGAGGRPVHVYTNVFGHSSENIPPPPAIADVKNISKNPHTVAPILERSRCSIPLKQRNIIGCGLAEVVVAIDRYAAMLARRDITYAKACWAVLIDSKADVQPYLRTSAVAIEKELLAATAAHEALNAAVGDPLKRPPLSLTDYPALAGW